MESATSATFVWEHALGVQQMSVLWGEGHCNFTFCAPISEICLVPSVHLEGLLDPSGSKCADSQTREKKTESLWVKRTNEDGTWTLERCDQNDRGSIKSRQTNVTFYGLFPLTCEPVDSPELSLGFTTPSQFNVASSVVFRLSKTNCVATRVR